MNINITTYLNQLGYGIAGLNITKAFVRAGFDVSLWVNGPGYAPQEDRALVEQAVARQGMFDPSAPSLRVAHQFDMAHGVGRGIRLGLTFFELDRLQPIEINHLLSLDKIFVPTAWAGQVLVKNNISIEQIEYAPLGVDTTIFNPSVQPAIQRGWEVIQERLTKNNTTVFFNSGKWEVRKGHDILAEAFKKAFGPNDNVFLIMNCQNPFLDENQHRQWAEYYQQRVGSYRLFIVEPRLNTQSDLAKLMALSDCGVFPARAEGWNLELLEMMAMGKSVVATNYSAHTEFCNPENCFLVEPDGMEPAYDGVFFKGGRDSGEWAELGSQALEQLVWHLQTIHHKKQNGLLKTNEAGLLTAKKYTWDNTVAEILSVI